MEAGREGEVWEEGRRKQHVGSQRGVIVFRDLATQNSLGLSQNHSHQQTPVLFYSLFRHAPSVVPNFHARNLHPRPPPPNLPPRSRRARSHHARWGAPRLARVPRRRCVAPPHARALHSPLLPPLPRRRRLRYSRRRPRQARLPPGRQLEAPRRHSRLRLRPPHGLRPRATCPRRSDVRVAGMDLGPRSDNWVGCWGLPLSSCGPRNSGFRDGGSGRVGGYSGRVGFDSRWKGVRVGSLGLVCFGFGFD